MLMEGFVAASVRNITAGYDLRVQYLWDAGTELVSRAVDKQSTFMFDSRWCHWNFSLT
jgi:hypothetical protein